jgi:DNA-binding NarL/FixJ family response regulator
MLLGQRSLLGSTIAVRWHTEHSLLFLKARPCCRADRLTPREQVVAQLVAQGQTYKQIAQSQGRSPSTIRNQIQLVYDKLEVSSIASLIRELQFAA